jgi:mRNA-degrading endonuclease RelE of RelBE toxin-antitoxin system
VVRLTRRAAKDLAELPEPLQEKARELLARLDADPALGKKLLGALKGLRSARLGSSYRVLYKLESSGPVAQAIRPRRDAYR